MTIERKIGMGIAGQPTGPAADVAEVFSTDLYNGNNSTQTITNGIDLDGEGGLIWIKQRTGTNSHYLHDTAMSASSDYHKSDSTSAVGTGIALTKNSNGFSIASTTWDGINATNHKYVAWTFRKKEKFFDIVNYTGNGATGRVISHDLGSTPAMIMIKATNQSDSWYVYHSANGFGQYLALDTNYSANQHGSYPPVSAASDTTFTTVLNTGVNSSGSTYVAYIFADNSSELADNQMIKCGSYTGTNSSDKLSIDLGWEPQFVLIKHAAGNGNWIMLDKMRAMTVYGGDQYLFANTTKVDELFSFINVTPTGFFFETNEGQVNASGKYIYMAIRAPMMKKPESGNTVFKAIQRTGTNAAAFVEVGFAPDLVINSRNDDGEQSQSEFKDRLRGRKASIKSHAVNVETNYGNATQDLVSFDSNGISLGTGAYSQINYANRRNILWCFKRAKGFFDMILYIGNATVRTVPHQLGVKPQLILAKARNVTNYWVTYDEPSGATKHMQLNDGNPSTASGDHWNNTEPTDSVITLGDGNYTNRNNANHVLYMFASVDGVSKVGTYTGTGSSQIIDCGFSNGARFVLSKCTTINKEWHVHDTTRGIVSGNDKRLELSTSAPEVRSSDEIDPHSSGFILDTQGDMNLSGKTYIFLAIA